jgi:hypothetical protein
VLCSTSTISIWKFGMAPTSRTIAGKAGNSSPCEAVVS